MSTEITQPVANRRTDSPHQRVPEPPAVPSWTGEENPPPYLPLLSQPQGAVMIMPEEGASPPQMIRTPFPPSTPVYPGGGSAFPYFYGFSPGSINEGKIMARLLGLEKEKEHIINQVKTLMEEIREREKSQRELMEEIREKDKSQREMIEEMREKDKSHREELIKVMNDAMVKERKIMELEMEKREWQKDKEIMELENKLLKSGRGSEDLEEKMKQVMRKEWPKTTTNEKSKEVIEHEVKRLVSSELEAWTAKKEQDQIDLRKIVAEERVAQKQSFRKDVVNVLKTSGNVVRDMAEQKKCVVVFGVKEEKTPDKIIRERYEINKIKCILNSLGEEWLQDEVEEIVRLGKFEEGKSRPVKVRLYSQAAAEGILANSWKLKELEPYKKVFIRRNMTEEERDNLNELLTTARQRNEERTDEERNQFFWRIKNEKLLKCLIRGSERAH